MGQTARGARHVLCITRHPWGLHPFGIGQALGLRAGGNSIDNTLRIGEIVRSHWVLLDVRIHQVVNGFGYGDVHLWSESGALLGTASQSTIGRRWPDTARKSLTLARTPSARMCWYEHFGAVRIRRSEGRRGAKRAVKINGATLTL